MKKSTKTTKTPKTETATVQAGPSVKAMMYRIATVTNAAAQRVKLTKADPATVYAYALRQIDTVTAEYWKTQNA